MKRLLLPISFLYSIVLFLRHKLYDWNILKSKSYDMPNICVGNLNLGGTGKTPHIEYLTNLLSEEQQNNVRNNREYESLTKEIEYQSLDIQLCEKRINDCTKKSEMLKISLSETTARLEERKGDLELKKNELSSIVEETEKEEQELMVRSQESEQLIEERLLTAYKRIRKNARNGLAVVKIERDACGGCFNKIPPQHQLDIRMHKKIIVCEYCGRILIDQDIVDMYHNEIAD